MRWLISRASGWPNYHRVMFFDIDTQIDFLYPAGALYVPGAEKIILTIAALNCYAAARGIPLVSTMCAHSEDDPEFQVWPPHCVAGTVGQQKPAATLAEKQVILEKQHNDMFSSAALAPILADAGAAEYFVYGVVTEVCVKLAALGLLKTGKPVTVVTDAVQAFDVAAAERFLTEFREAGGRVTTVSRMLGGGV